MEDVKPVYIYGLVDPETTAIRYIGKSIHPEERLRNHINEKYPCHRRNWIDSLKNKGLEPELIYLVKLEGNMIDDWKWWERKWIAIAKRDGWPLVNETSGGDGVPDLSDDAKAKMIKTWTGRKHKPESIAKMAAASRGRRKTPEQKESMRKLMTGRKILWVDKVAESLRKLTPEDAEIIKIRLANGEKNCNLAKEYGVHRTTLSKIKMGTYFVGKRGS
jgi:hypothetical protein